MQQTSTFSLNVVLDFRFQLSEKKRYILLTEPLDHLQDSLQVGDDQGDGLGHGDGLGSEG